ncbi:MAG: dihydrodipicolinate synthase family protein [Acidobacteriaceae bacterium]|nr:dihydrodipicolinate synthase family protein [Acidobacteriaceae bacterium]
MADSQDDTLASGVYAALATPRRPNSIEAETGALLDYLDTVVRAGVDGLVLFGSTGEFVHFDTEERMRVLSLAIKRSRVPVLANVSHSTLAGAIDLAENAVDCGAAGLLLMPPYFYRYQEEQIYEFYLQFLRLLDDRVPVYLYNLPAYTNALTPLLLDRLLTGGAFAGIKDSSADFNLLEHIRALRARHVFQLLVGSESLYLRGRKGGADGIVSGVAAALPELMVALEHAIRESDMNRAESLNARLLEFVAYVDKFPATVAIKQAAVVRGWMPTPVPVPFDEDMAAEVIAFHHWFRSWLPGVLAECKKSGAVSA